MDVTTIGIAAMITIPFVGLTVWAVVSAATREFNSPGMKAVWVIVAGIPFIGFIVYFLIGIRMSRKPEALVPAENSD